MDGPSIPCPDDNTCGTILFVNLRQAKLPLVSRFRLGGEIILPYLWGGLYLNLGELADFVCGLTTLDIAGDDGMPKGHGLHERFRPLTATEETQPDSP